MMVYGALLAVLFIGLTVVLFSHRVRIVRKIAVLLLADWVVLIFCSTVVFRTPREVSSINLLPLWSYFDYAENSYLKEMAAVNFLNLVMFIPIGVLVKLGFHDFTWKQILLVGIILSAAIEITQFVFKRGLCELDDIVHNVIGCMLGFWLCYVIVKTRNKYV